jgi:hypothetical protein
VSDGRPTLRLLHQLARSGGTVLARCLAGMRGVTVLSEIHPEGARAALEFDPVFQAQYWFKLLPDAEARALGEAGFAARIARIAERAGEQGERLVLRDWSHLDFHGRPILPGPTGGPALAESLGSAFRLVRTCTVRHPAAQWLSWRRFMPEAGIALGDFMAGVRAFARMAAELGFLRYEDFSLNPDHALAELAWRLEVPFDPGWAYRWLFCRAVTGDLDSLGRHRIEPARPPRLDPETHAALQDNADYRLALDLLGYEADWVEVTPEGAPALATGRDHHH